MKILAPVVLGAVAAAAYDATDATHPHLEDMVHRVFAVDEKTAVNEKAIDDYFAKREGP